MKTNEVLKEVTDYYNDMSVQFSDDKLPDKNDHESGREDILRNEEETAISPEQTSNTEGVWYPKTDEEVSAVIKKSITPPTHPNLTKKQKMKMRLKEITSYVLAALSIITGLAIGGKKLADEFFPEGIPSFSEINGEDYSDKLEHVLILKAAAEIKNRYGINEYHSDPNNYDSFYYMPSKFVPKMVEDGLSVRDIAYFTYITTGYANVAEEAVDQAVVWYKYRGITVTDEKKAEALEIIDSDEKLDEYNQYFAPEYHGSKDIASYIEKHKAEIVHATNKGGNK